VGVLLSMLSMTVGLRQAWLRAGSPERALILPATSDVEGNGALSRGAAALIATLPGIAKDAHGRPIADAEFIGGLSGRRRPDGMHSGIWLRGFGPMAVELRPEFHIVAGRMFTQGKHELIVGEEAPGQFFSVGLGDKVTMPDGQWPVVGVFRGNKDVLQ